MKEELDKLLFTTLCELHPDRLSANPKDVQGLMIMEGALNFLEGIYKVQDKNWEPSEEFKKLKEILELIKKEVKPKFLKGGVVDGITNCGIVNWSEEHESGNNFIINGDDRKESMRRLMDDLNLKNQ